MLYDLGTLWRPYGMLCGIRLPSVRPCIPAVCGYGHNQCGVVRLPVQCSAVTSAGYELALGGSQTCNIWLPSYHLISDQNHLKWHTAAISGESESYSCLPVSIATSGFTSSISTLCVIIYFWSLLHLTKLRGSRQQVRASSTDFSISLQPSLRACLSLIELQNQLSAL